jgi:hypothetical protein
LGRKAVKVNKKKMALIGLAATTLFSVPGCGRNETEGVYGVPVPETVTEQRTTSEALTEQRTTSETVTEQRTTSEAVTAEQNIPEPVYGPEAQIYDYDKMSEEEIAELEARREDVCEYLREFKSSEEFQAADLDKRVEMFYAELEDLSVNGTEKYPEPFVKADSWVYHEEEEEVEFEFIDGLPIFWAMSDKFEKSIQESTDVELP